MSFLIRFKTASDEVSFEPSSDCAEGIISLGDFRESFVARTDYWATEDYHRSWTHNLVRVRQGQDGFFATDISDPLTAGIFRVWPVVWVEGCCYLTEKLLLRSRAEVDFRPERIPELIDFAHLADSVSRISSWALTVADLRDTRIGPTAN